MKKNKEEFSYTDGIQPIDYIDSWSMNYNEGCVIQYLTRAKYKGNELEDLKTAKFFLERQMNIVKLNLESVEPEFEDDEEESKEELAF